MTRTENYPPVKPVRAVTDARILDGKRQLDAPARSGAETSGNASDDAFVRPQHAPGGRAVAAAPRALDALLKGTRTERAGPPAGDAPLGVFVVDGHVFVVASDADGETPVSVWHERLDGKAGPHWWDVGAPRVPVVPAHDEPDAGPRTKGKAAAAAPSPPSSAPDARFPRAGATPVVVRGQLTLWGGIDATGSLLRWSWTTDLKALANGAAHTATWSAARGLGRAVAFAAGAGTSDGVVLSGGVAAIAVLRKGQDPKDAVSAHAALRKGYVILEELDPPPVDSTGGTAVAFEGRVYQGPGMKLDGKLAVFADDRQLAGGARREHQALPALPRGGGMGQLLIDSTARLLIYAGGLKQDGSATGDVFTLNVDRPLDGWTRAGTSPIEGIMRAVFAEGAIYALDMAEEGSRLIVMRAKTPSKEQAHGE